MRPYSNSKLPSEKELYVGFFKRNWKKIGACTAMIPLAFSGSSEFLLADKGDTEKNKSTSSQIKLVTSNRFGYGFNKEDYKSWRHIIEEDYLHSGIKVKKLLNVIEMKGAELRKLKKEGGLIGIAKKIYWITYETSDGRGKAGALILDIGNPNKNWSGI